MKKQLVINGKTVELKFLYTAGQEQFNVISIIYY